MRLRYLVSFVAAAVVTFSLLFVMQALVKPKADRREDETSARRIEFVRLKRESEVQTRKREAPERPRPQQSPSAPPTPTMAMPVRMPTQQVPMSVPVAGPPVELAGAPVLGEAPADTEAVPLVRVTPQYPTSALSRGLEGWVEVSFTITPEGTVEDPVVIGRSSGSKVFDREAIRAIKRWKYKPKIDNGVAVARSGVLVRLNFTLEDQ